MITGFNTDIRHGERVFHVQTEDRGVANPIVESLVYVGGQILLSKRSPYADLVSEGKADEQAVRQLMDLQHRRIIEAIRRGRFDDAFSSATGATGASGAAAPETAPAKVEAPISPAAAAAAAAILAGGPGSGAIPRPPASGAVPKPPVSGAVAKAATGADRSLDQVIIEYLAAEAASERLELNLVKGGELVSGESVSLSVRASTSLTDRAVAGAHITLRVVSNVGPTQVLHRGVTGGDGLVKVTATLPDIGNGNAALIVSATSGLGNQEIKQLIRKKSQESSPPGA